MVITALPARSQYDCYAGDVHAQPITVSGFLIRYQKSWSAEQGAVCRVEVYSLQGGMAFHTEDAGIRIVQAPAQDINGDGIPDVIFEGYSGGAHCCYTYWMLSLGSRPHLLKSFKNQSPAKFITGREGKIEIQTSDGAFDYFDCLSHAESPQPTVFMRLEAQTVKNTGIEHWPEYEAQIREARHGITAAQLRQFREAKNQDQLCTGESRAAMPLVLSIVLAELYAGHQLGAWKSLDEMWPAFDRQRIRTEILRARAQGILKYTGPMLPGRRHHRQAR